jgi:pimeloyl-ACP methyl ester carboxylesterase
MKKLSHLALVVVALSVLATTAGLGTLVHDAPTSDSVRHISSAAEMTPAVRYVDVDGVTLGYREYGAGEPLLLICGFGATMDNWNATFVHLLATQCHVFTYDHRGMGYSTENNATPTMALYADDAVGLMHALGFQSANIYGTSMGSSISQQLAIDHPEAVRKMVLSSASYSLHIPECQTLLHLIESIATNSSYSNGTRHEAQANLAWNGSWNGLAGIQKPVMLIVGTNDVLTPDVVSVQIAGQISASWLVRFKGIPHSGQSYAPVQYAESVMYFLALDETPIFTPIAPTAPTNLTAVSGIGTIALTWNASVCDGGSRITGYILYRGSQPIATLNSSTLSYVDRAVNPGTAYTYCVAAINAVGSSAISSPFTASPRDASPDVLLLLIGFAAAAVVVVAIAVMIGTKK